MEESDGPTTSEDESTVQSLQLKRLTLEQVQRIDMLLDSIGEYGELHLIVQHGELRYINRVESFKAWKSNMK